MYLYNSFRAVHRVSGVPRLFPSERKVELSRREIVLVLINRPETNRKIPEHACKTLFVVQTWMNVMRMERCYGTRNPLPVVKNICSIQFTLNTATVCNSRK